MSNEEKTQLTQEIAKLLDKVTISEAKDVLYGAIRLCNERTVIDSSVLVNQ